MKFKIDEVLPRDYGEILRQADHDVATLFDEGMRGKSDPLIADACPEESRILISLDRDFSDIRSYPPEQYPGIIALSVARQDKGHLIKVLRGTMMLFDCHPIHNKLWIVQENRGRIRSASDEPA